MGYSHSKSKDLILSVLKGRGSKVSKKSCNDFYDFILKVKPWFPEEGTLSLQNWKRVGKEMRRFYKKHGPEEVPTPAFSIWIQIRDLLNDNLEREFLAEAALSEQDKESDKNPKSKEKEKKWLVKTLCLKII